MCGRFTLTERDLVRLARALGAEVDAGLARAWRPRYNVAPGQPALLVRDAGGLRLEQARFGLGGGGGPLRFNARSETAADRRALVPGSPLPRGAGLGRGFRAAWATRRCAVPADGFYEWAGARADRRPIWFHDPSRRPLLFAALFDEEGGALGFSILTTAARAPVTALHDRMPVILPEGGLQRWLAGGDPPGPGPEGALVGEPVSPRVNAVANDDPECLEAPGPPRQLELL